MKKNLIIILSIIIFGVLIVILGCLPKLLKEYEIKSNAIVKNNCKIVVQDILNIKDVNLLEQKSEELISDYNKTYTNPLTKKEDAFTTDKKCMGCVSINYDNDTKSISITGYDKNLEILCRTVIKPPSFITYEKEEK